MGSLYQVWDPCTKYGTPVPSMGPLYQVWDPCTKYGIPVPSMGSLYQVWDPCTKYGIPVPSMGSLYQVWTIRKSKNVIFVSKNVNKKKCGFLFSRVFNFAQQLFARNRRTYLRAFLGPARNCAKISTREN